MAAYYENIKKRALQVVALCEIAQFVSNQAKEHSSRRF
ncbi:hypothetical protein EYZ11_009202 [Aspergillus tanneri]|uniref:Uncharacterized protein n=1 Tax=Aspergillus tanneri TaxID=1220188 RepID=A0A4S3JAM5_9EURO|nr:hypothetical protein EYZ11_009202 [Aspergillus tanneri]